MSILKDKKKLSTLKDSQLNSFLTEINKIKESLNHLEDAIVHDILKSENNNYCSNLNFLEKEVTLSNFFKEERLKHRLTLKEVAEFIGCSIVYIHQIEKGQCKNISIKIFKKISELFNYSADNLLNFIIFD